jgi:Holliday junction resolvase RusA-like endonuclease
VNNLFHNLRNGGRRRTARYTSWIDGELKALTAQRAKPISARASVAITLPNATRGDCDNRIKPVLDLLVKAGVLADDSGKHVGAVSVTFGDVQMMHVAVEPMAVAA